MNDVNFEKAKKIMGKEPINPIGSCFDSSAFQFLFADDTPQDARLCHGVGIANMPGQEGRKIAHAWIEFDDGCRTAYDTTWGVRALVSVYRNQLQLDYIVEYTHEEAFRLWRKTDYPGPWDSKIKAISDKANSKM